MNRRAFLKRTTGFLISLIGLTGGTHYYSKEIEPSSLHIQKETIQSAKLTNAFHNKKIVQFSDTHLGFNYTVKDLKKLVKQINELAPDIIVFTGDLIDDPKQVNDTEEKKIIQALQPLHAPKGKYWIYGNHDHGGYGTEKVFDIMTQAEFTLLQNSHTVIEENNEKLIIAGIDDLMLGKPNLSAALHQTNQDIFTILLAHEPDFADQAVKHAVDVQLSGHSHGGQIRLPIVGHIYSPAFAEKYVLGKYTLKDKLQLFVNGGIGTTRVPYRLFCKPEIHEYTLQSNLS
ncbi:metallophosphoesterase [Oceanobacillus sp. FSL H7-0719]|uniref:metallophosphoesterase n=1 Tax=Oceanobacillus sp. FSL H7-0719 TaxID=2954507 RepID=UPI003255890D